nr:MAG TPA: hypothetical protein [Caudoviricetes sp.]
MRKDILLWHFIITSGNLELLQVFITSIYGNFKRFIATSYANKQQINICL